MEKVLIIDDFEPVRKTIKRIVEREKFVAIQASDGKEGLAVFEKEKPDIVITDLKMPHIDGKGVLCAIKEQSPETDVVVLTGYGDSETANYLLKKGAFRYLKKPLDLQELIKVLAELRARLRSKKPAPAFKNDPLRDIHVSFTSKEDIRVEWDGDERESARRFVHLFCHQLPVPLILINDAFDILFSNQAFERIVGSDISTLNESVVTALQSQGATLPSTADFRANLSKIFNEKDPMITPENAQAYQAMGLLKINALLTGKNVSLLVLFFPQAQPPRA